MKAPYIPMNIGDDLPLLMSDDIVWSASSDKTNSNRAPDINSSLAQLLCANGTKESPCKMNDHGGGMIPGSDSLLSDLYDDKSKLENFLIQHTLSVNLIHLDLICDIEGCIETYNYCKSSFVSGCTNWDLPKTLPKLLDRNELRSSAIKRTNLAPYDTMSKRSKNDPKEKMSSELLQQLMSNNTQRGRPKGKSNWLLDSGQKAACISQPSDSVLMNLLVSGFDIRAGYICLAPTRSKH